MKDNDGNKKPVAKTILEDPATTPVLTFQLYWVTTKYVGILLFVFATGWRFTLDPM